jgi:hypothetical protein
LASTAPYSPPLPRFVRLVDLLLRVVNISSEDDISYMTKKLGNLDEDFTVDCDDGKRAEKI